MVSDSLWSNGLLHARLLCPLLSPGVFLNSCPSRQWCYLTISFSATSFSFYLQFFPALGSFATSGLFASGGQSSGASASASVIPMNIQDWFPLGLNGLISFLSKGFIRVLSRTTIQTHQFLGPQTFLWTNSFIHTWLLENKQTNKHRFDYMDLC